MKFEQAVLPFVRLYIIAAINRDEMCDPSQIINALVKFLMECSV